MASVFGNSVAGIFPVYFTIEQVPVLKVMISVFIRCLVPQFLCSGTSSTHSFPCLAALHLSPFLFVYFIGGLPLIPSPLFLLSYTLMSKSSQSNMLPLFSLYTIHFPCCNPYSDLSDTSLSHVHTITEYLTFPLLNTCTCSPCYYTHTESHIP